MEGNGKGNTVLLTVIGVATLLVALVGATFAYFTATISTTSTQSVVVETAVPVGLTYAGPNTITLDNAIPGATDTQTFTVTNPVPDAGADTGYPQTYDLNLLIDENTFVATDGAEQLLISIAPSTEGGTNTPSLSTSFTGGKTLDVTASYTTTTNIVNDQRIDVGETHSYAMTVNFVELSKEQNTNQGKKFVGHVEISDPQTINAA